MTTETPLTAAWSRIRQELTSTAETHRENGTAVIEAIADHGTVQASTGEPLTFVFTLPGDTIGRLRDRVSEDAVSGTDVRYADVDGHRLYLLGVRTTDDVRILVAGGVRHDRLAAHADASGRARTRLRGVDGTVGIRLEHDDVAPFVGGLE